MNKNVALNWSSITILVAKFIMFRKIEIKMFNLNFFGGFVFKILCSQQRSVADYLGIKIKWVKDPFKTDLWGALQARTEPFTTDLTLYDQFRLSSLLSLNFILDIRGSCLVDT